MSDERRKPISREEYIDQKIEEKFKEVGYPHPAEEMAVRRTLSAVYSMEFSNLKNELPQPTEAERLLARLAIGDSVEMSREKPGFNEDVVLNNLVNLHLDFAAYKLAAEYLGEPYAAETLGIKPRRDERVSTLKIDIIQSSHLKAAIKLEVEHYLSLNKTERNLWIAERANF